jgi:hypothetical protein
MEDEVQQDKPEEQEPQEPQEQDEPDEDTGTGVEPAETEGDQGEWVEQAAVGSTATAFDPDRPVRVSPPDAHQQSGVPELSDGDNEGVEPNEEMRGSVEPSPPEAEDEDEDNR